ncbi:DoxX family protein [Candidatus Woesearchaeota archaeon]|nr:DoxX family protein [Candidatus Woesearchaeota archaeon]
MAGKNAGIIEQACATCGTYKYFVFRVLVGLLFMLHGAGKLGLMGNGNVAGFAGAFGLPLWLGWIAALVEFVGGLAVLLGLFTRLAAVFGGVQMVVAWFLAHAPKGWNPMANGGELAVLFFAAFLVLIVYGAGTWSLEKAIMGKEYF